MTMSLFFVYLMGSQQWTWQRQQHSIAVLGVSQRHFVAENKAGYTATPVACGWAGLYLRSLHHLGRSSEAKDRKKTKKVKCGGRTNGPTDQRTDKAGCRVAWLVTKEKNRLNESVTVSLYQFPIIMSSYLYIKQLYSCVGHGFNLMLS